MEETNDDDDEDDHDDDDYDEDYGGAPRLTLLVFRSIPIPWLVGP